MAQSRTSPLRQLEMQGYLSLNKFVEYLRENAPEAAISYPTAVKLVAEGKIIARRMGGSWRIGRAEIDRWVSQGNYEPDTYSPYPKHTR